MEEEEEDSDNEEVEVKAKEAKMEVEGATVTEVNAAEEFEKAIEAAADKGVLDEAFVRQMNAAEDECNEN